VKIEEAFEMIKNVCASVSLNLEGHQRLQAAIDIIMKELFKEIEEKEKS